MNSRSRWLALAAMLALASCSPSGDGPSGEAGDGPAAYGNPGGSSPGAGTLTDGATGALAGVKVRPPTPAALPTNALLAVLQSELSPATLWRSREDRVRVFADLQATGLGGPSFLSYSSPTGITSMRPGDVIEGVNLRENWMLAGFAGSAGWTNWDSPWAVFLQRRPARVSFGTNGVEFQFQGAAGYFALMPLYGYEKPPQEGRAFDAGPGPGAPALRGAKGRDPKLLTWEWRLAVARDPLTRLRYWAGATRRFPVRCEDTVSIDRGTDTVTLRQRFEWLEVPDEWGTRPIRIAPVSPTLGLVLVPGESFPVTFDKPPFDFGIATPFGPFFGIPDVDAYEMRFPVLKYVNSTEAPVAAVPADAPPVVMAALERLRATARARFSGTDRFQPDAGSPGDGVPPILGELWYAKALPYYDPVTRSNAVSSLGRYFREEVLVPGRFLERELPGGSGRPWLVLRGSGEGSEVAGQLAASLLQGIWAYAHFTGDHALIRDRWPLIRRLFSTASEVRWAGFGRDGTVELGDEAAPAIAFARLAYMAGDLNAYHRGCALFARQLVLLHVKQRGARWFRDRQPWHSMEPIDAEVFPTRIGEGPGGWQFDGPRYPALSPERLSTRRWFRFQDLDVARFYRDHLLGDVRTEFERLAGRWDPGQAFTDQGHLLPSRVRLESFLLNPPSTNLAVIAMPGRFEGTPSGVIASCLAVLRTSQSPRYQRLIPSGPPTAFLPDLEHDLNLPGPHPYLVQSVGMGTSGAPTWPRIEWPAWKTPTGNPWNFGTVQAGDASGFEPGPARFDAVNRNTVRIQFEGPTPGPRPGDGAALPR